MPQSFTRYRVEVFTPRLVEEDREVQAVGTIIDQHVEEPLRELVAKMNRDFKRAGLLLTVTMRAF